MEEKVEAKVRVHGGWKYLHPPKDEEAGHDIIGSTPEWIKTPKKEHSLCDAGIKGLNYK